MYPLEMMHDTVWFEREKFEDELANYHLHVASKSIRSATSSRSSDCGLKRLASTAADNRTTPKKCKLDVDAKQSGLSERVSVLEKENANLKSLINQLVSRISNLEVNLEDDSQIHGKNCTVKIEEPVKEESDEDGNLWGSDDSEDEEDEERKQEALKRYNERKAKKPALIAKSSITLDVKPWDDETDLKAIEEAVRAITLDGLLWGKSKLIPMAYGIKKLQINGVVEDAKVGTDILEEEILKHEDLVQSVDVAAFQKI